jgi:glycerophosphoryl diester phosphodiesterase
VNDETNLEQAAKAGVDTVITDDVRLVVGTLRPG